MVVRMMMTSRIHILFLAKIYVSDVAVHLGFDAMYTRQ